MADTTHTVLSGGLQPGESWLHVGIHYFRPRRPTFIKLDLLPDRVWQHRVVKPRYQANGDVVCLTVYQAMLAQNLDAIYVMWSFSDLWFSIDSYQIGSRIAC